MEEKKLTGYPSIDKPWLKYYSEEAIRADVPKGTIFQNVHIGFSQQQPKQQQHVPALQRAGRVSVCG